MGNYLAISCMVVDDGVIVLHAYITISFPLLCFATYSGHLSYALSFSRDAVSLNSFVYVLYVRKWFKFCS